MTQAGLALSAAAAPANAGAWIEGLLRGSGMVLLHEEELWIALDAWLVTLADDVFVELLPVLRRAVSGFQSPERRAMGDIVKRLGGKDSTRRVQKPSSTSTKLDEQRVKLVLPILAHVLGVKPVEPPNQ
jgi:hypothetical protein